MDLSDKAHTNKICRHAPMVEVPAERNLVTNEKASNESFQNKFFFFSQSLIFTPSTAIRQTAGDLISWIVEFRVLKCHTYFRVCTLISRVTHHGSDQTIITLIL